MARRFASRTRIAAVGMVAVAALTLTSCSGSVSNEPTIDIATLDDSLESQIDAAVEKAMELSGSTEAIVGVWNGEDQGYVRGYGEGNIGGDTPIRAAQASQPVVCAMLLDLVDEGKLSLDREISKDLTRQVGIEGITYAQLCDMRSGLADYKKQIAEIFVDNPSRYWPDQELISEGLVKSPLSWPSLDVHVSDTNAVLLGRVLKVETGEELQDLYAEHVFQKAGMGDSYFPTLTDTSAPDGSMAALTYSLDGSDPVCEAGVTQVEEVSPSMLSSAGATVTTVNDLHSFYTQYLDGAWGGDAASVVTETNPLKNPERDDEGNPTEEEASEGGNQWGFGVKKVGPYYGQSGAITGTLTAAFQDPDTDFTVVIALNNSTSGAAFAEAFALQLAAISADAGVGPEVTWSAEDKLSAMQKRAACDGQAVTFASAEESSDE